jgi:hypothetical protein
LYLSGLHIGEERDGAEKHKTPRIEQHHDWLSFKGNVLDLLWKNEIVKRKPGIEGS